MKINYEKSADRLVPAIVQDAETDVILMLGFMNREAFERTQETGRVTFYSRTRQTIWTKGERSGHFLDVQKLLIDCDADTILVKAKPHGAACHTGADTCFNEANEARKITTAAAAAEDDNFLFALEKTIRDRKQSAPESSYTAKLFAKGLNKIAQKVGEEAVELIIEAKDHNEDAFKAEAADLLYHFLVLLAAKNVRLEDVLETLRERRG